MLIYLIVFIVLQGGYLNIDEYKSKLMVLAEKFGDESVKRVFNNDWI